VTPPATILIIDDVAASRDELAAMVEGLGHRAVVAASGLEGLGLLREVRPSLVLLDLVMPDVDGFKVAAAIKSQPLFVPVVLLTAIDDIESKRRGQAAGADDCLTKPVVPLELQIRIAAMLRIKSLTDELDAANRRLAELAETDGLTNIANRRRFDRMYAHEHERADRYARPLSVLLCDLDHFKRVNDTYGHGAGDQVLLATAQALARTVRQSDTVGRLGGEEFGVLAPEVGPSGALALGERLRRAVEVLEPAPSGGPRVTISVGAVAWDGRGKVDMATLLERADKALYEAKQSGRNRVVLAVVPAGARHD
jgi:diguanylate cyclase (GGDEF)-like protein